MALSTVILTGTYIDGLGNALGGQVLFIPNVPLIDTTDQQLMRQAAITITLDPDGHFSVPLVATDNENLAPDGWCWTIKEMVTGIAPYAWSFFLPYGGGATQDISSLDAVVLAPPVAQYLPISGGTLTGPLTLSGAPTTALMAATKAYVDTETSRAEAAETAKLPLAGGTMTGAITLPGNPSASLQAAPKQYVDTETTRAQTAEALLLPLAGGTVTGALILTGPSPFQITHGAASGDILTANSSGQASWQPGGAGVTIDQTNADIKPLGTQSWGSLTTAAAADHVHATTSIINGVAVSGTPALNKTILCTDATHATWSTPAAGVTLDTTDTPATLTGSGSPGMSGQAACADHEHPTTNVLDGVTVSGSPAAGLILACTSSSAAQWLPAGDSTGSDIQPLGSQSASASSGSIAKAAYADHVHPTTSVINGVTVSGSPGNGKIIVCSTSSAASWLALTDSNPSDIQPLAASAAQGGIGTPSDAGHVHPWTGLALLAGAAFTGAVSTAAALTAGVVALTDATTIGVNASQGNHFRVTLGGNHGLGVPSSPADGQKITFEIIQPSSGSTYTLTYASTTGGYEFAAAGQPVLTTANSGRDLLGFVYSSSKSRWLYAGGSLAFA